MCPSCFDGARDHDVRDLEHRAVSELLDMRADAHGPLRMAATRLEDLFDVSAGHLQTNLGETRGQLCVPIISVDPGNLEVHAVVMKRLPGAHQLADCLPIATREKD